MPILDIDQDFASKVLNDALDKLCKRFAWSRSEAYDFLLGSSVAWRVHQGQTDARIAEKVQQTLAECHSVTGTPKPTGSDSNA